MTRVLAVETSTELLGVAVVDDSGIRCEFSLFKPRVHSEMLLPMCIHVMSVVGLGFEDIDCFAVSSGPGSFTGLRIGSATVQGLAFSLDKPVAKVPTFQVYLRQCSAFSKVGIVQGKAKSQRVCALYEKSETLPRTFEDSHGVGFHDKYGFSEVVPLGSLSQEEFSGYLRRETHTPVWLAGDAAQQFFSAALEEGISCLKVVDGHLRLPSPGVLGLIGFEMYLAGEVVKASLAVPEYYRRSQAEVVFTRKMKKG